MMANSMLRDSYDPAQIVYSPQDVANAGLARIRYLHDNPDAGLPIYIPSVDEKFVPLTASDLCTLLGRPGNGKTSVAKRWVRTRASHLPDLFPNEHRIIVNVSYEQHIEALHSFDVAADQGISVTRMARGHISDEEFERVILSSTSRIAMPVWEIGHSLSRSGVRPAITVSKLALALEYIQEEGYKLEKESGKKFIIDAVFVDYLQLIPLEGHHEGKTLGVMDNLERLKNGAKAFACPFVVLSQAKARVDDYDIQIPGMNDGEWTDAITQFSDTIIVVVRPQKYRKDGEKFGSVVVDGPNQMLVSVPKQKLAASNFAKWISFDVEMNSLFSMYDVETLDLNATVHHYMSQGVMEKELNNYGWYKKWKSLHGVGEAK